MNKHFIKYKKNIKIKNNIKILIIEINFYIK